MKLNIHQWLGLIVAALLTGMFLSECEAAEADLYLDINMGSIHTRDYWWTNNPDGSKTEHKFNGKNFGLGLSYGLNDYFDISTGYYKNSYNKTSVYGGTVAKYPITWPNSWLRLEPGIKLMAATGYTNTVQEKDTIQGILVAPMLHLGITIMDTISANIGYKPDFDGKNGRYDDDSNGIITFQISTKLASF